MQVDVSAGILYDDNTTGYESTNLTAEAKRSSLLVVHVPSFSIILAFIRSVSKAKPFSLSAYANLTTRTGSEVLTAQKFLVRKKRSN